MTKFWRKVDSFLGAAVLTAGGVVATYVQTTGHVPTERAGWATIGGSVLAGLIRLGWKALNPNDPAFGVGSLPEPKP